MANFQEGQFSRSLATSLYQQVYLQLRSSILSGKLKGGAKLPSTRALAEELGVSRNTILSAYQQLLAAQAVTAFAGFEAEKNLKFDRIYEVYSQRFKPEDLEGDKFDPKVLPSSYLTNPDLKHAFVYISTIQRMRINLFGYPEGGPWGNDGAVVDGEAESDAGTWISRSTPSI